MQSLKVSTFSEVMLVIACLGEDRRGKGAFVAGIYESFEQVEIEEIS